MNLVASVIVSPVETDRYLAENLAHLLEFCDEVRVLVDGEMDERVSEMVAGKAKLQASADVTFFGHEGAARNLLLEWTLRAEPSHVVAVDADEFVTDGAALRRELAAGAELVSAEMVEVWEATAEGLCVRVDGGWVPHPVTVGWRVPSPFPSGWRIADRKLACGRVPDPLARARGRVSAAEVLHFGWAREAERIARHARYVAHDGGRFHRSAHLDSILWPCGRVQLESMVWPAGLVSHRDAILATVGRPMRERKPTPVLEPDDA